MAGRKKTKSGKRANGEGNIRQRADGSWEARFYVGRDSGTGKPIRKSVYGKTQAEVRKKLTAATHEVDEKTYTEPSKMLVSQWLDKWVAEYTKHLKPYTLRSYKSQITNHIKPYIGAVKVSELGPDTIQLMYNRLSNECKLSAKTIRNVHGILHAAFETLVDIGTIKTNPCASCAKKLPKVQKMDLQTQTQNLADDNLSRFIETIKGNPYENIFLVDLFTGMRQGEILGLRWSCIDFERGCITIDKQLYMPEKGESYRLEPLKNRKTRIIWPAQFVFTILKKERAKQLSNRLKAGSMWDEGNLPGLVFTNEFGKYISHKTVYKQFKRAAAECGIPTIRFHDMRHTYAATSLRSGDDAKTVQENMGHATAAFTLDQYAFATVPMKKESADRMDKYIASIGQ